MGGVAEFKGLRSGLTQWIGCGCLSISRCALSNPGDCAGRGIGWCEHEGDAVDEPDERSSRRSVESRKRGLGRVVENAKKRLCGASGEALALLPVSHRVERHADASGESGLREAGAPAYASDVRGHLTGGFRVVFGGLAGNVGLVGGIAQGN